MFGKVFSFMIPSLGKELEKKTAGSNAELLYRQGYYTLPLTPPALSPVAWPLALGSLSSPPFFLTLKSLKPSAAPFWEFTFLGFENRAAPKNATQIPPEGSGEI